MERELKSELQLSASLHGFTILSLFFLISCDLLPKLQRPTSLPNRPTNLPDSPWHLLVPLATRKRQKTFDEILIHFRKTIGTKKEA